MARPLRIMFRALFSASLFAASPVRLTAAVASVQPETAPLAASSTLEAEPINVLMIVVDDLRPPVSALQSTPNIDRLKAAGVSFSRA